MLICILFSRKILRGVKNKVISSNTVTLWLTIVQNKWLLHPLSIATAGRYVSIVLLILFSCKDINSFILYTICVYLEKCSLWVGSNLFSVSFPTYIFILHIYRDFKLLSQSIRIYVDSYYILRFLTLHDEVNNGSDCVSFVLYLI